MKRSLPTNDEASVEKQKPRQVRLLLHAVNGCVPYLSPSVLQANFPPSDTLWIGMAVRDISVVANFNASKRQANEQKEKQVAAKTEQQRRKPRGFTFASVPSDPWLLPYQRITVPSFDLLQDNNNHNSNIQRQISESRQQKSGKSPQSTSTDRHIQVWTPHGRQKLTPDLYDVAAKGLASQVKVSLFDMNEFGTSKKREAKARERNETWFQQLQRQDQLADSSSPKIWYPLLIPSSDDGRITPFPNTLLNGGEGQSLDGIAMVGSFQSERVKRVLQQMKQANVIVENIAILSTGSLVEVLDILCSCEDINVIGTELPTRWAKNHLALGVRFDSAYNHERKSKKVRAEQVAESSRSSTLLTRAGCIDLSDSIHARDTSPLVEGCSCMTCERFSRSYIHHLVCAKELVAEILLFAHNLHHILAMIQVFSASQLDPSMFRERILDQLPTMSPTK